MSIALISQGPIEAKSLQFDDTVCVIKVGESGGPLMLPVQAEAKDQLFSYGFSEIECDADRQALISWSSKFCTTSTKYNKDIIKFFKNEYGLKPAKLCVASIKWRKVAERNAS